MEIIYSENAPNPIGPYSQAILAGDTLYCSGQIPVDAVSGSIVGSTAAEQTQQVIQNLSAVLSAAGMGFHNVVKATCYLKSMDDFAEFNEVFAKHFVSSPARACVEVSRLPKDVLVEVDVIAVAR